MARTMQRVFASGVADGTTVFPLTVPAGKKYEVLFVSVHHAANPLCTISVAAQNAGTNIQIGQAIAGEANRVVNSYVYSAVCLTSGDQLWIIVSGSGATWRYHVTYMDVDV